MIYTLVWVDYHISYPLSVWSPKTWSTTPSRHWSDTASPTMLWRTKPFSINTQTKCTFSTSATQILTISSIDFAKKHFQSAPSRIRGMDPRHPPNPRELLSLVAVLRLNRFRKTPWIKLSIDWRSLHIRIKCIRSKQNKKLVDLRVRIQFTRHVDRSICHLWNPKARRKLEYVFLIYIYILLYNKIIIIYC